MDADAASDGTFVLRIERKYLAGFAVDSITPTPDSVKVDGPWLVYSFTAQDAAEGLLAEFGLTPQGLWSVAGDVSLPTGDSVSIRHFIYL